MFVFYSLPWMESCLGLKTYIGRFVCLFVFQLPLMSMGVDDDNVTVLIVVTLSHSESYLDFSFCMIFISFMPAYLYFKCILIKIPSTSSFYKHLTFFNSGTFFSIISWYIVFLSSTSLSYSDNAFGYMVQFLDLSSMSLKINVSQQETLKKFLNVSFQFTKFLFESREKLLHPFYFLKIFELALLLKKTIICFNFTSVCLISKCHIYLVLEVMSHSSF